MRPRTTMAVVVLGLILVCLVDAGSILFARIAVTDSAQDAGRAAVSAVAGRPVDGETAIAAYAAAEAAVADDDEQVRRDDFIVHADGSVELTLIRVAPTLLLGRLPLSREWVEVSSTRLQTPPTTGTP